ncbi:hypothetical protein [Sorangium sp. So ce1078]|uniref:hypothetical protein n=1 Tax=Sorangium sp. So ce1078 TaxID=3133329 RepID=UPI003F627552
MTAFFFWTAWVCAAERPGTGASYTNNWPHEPLIGNVPTTPNVIWSIVSIVLLLAGIGALVWYHAFRQVPGRCTRHGPLMSRGERAVGEADRGEPRASSARARRPGSTGGGPRARRSPGSACRPRPAA